jgi:hypothetical protein
VDAGVSRQQIALSPWLSLAAFPLLAPLPIATLLALKQATPPLRLLAAPLVLLAHFSDR